MTKRTFSRILHHPLKLQFPLAPLFLFLMSLFIAPTAQAHPFASPPTLPAQTSCTLRIVVIQFAQPKVKFYVEDKSGNRSKPFEFSWTCGEGEFKQPLLASAQPLTVQPMAGGQLNIQIHDLSIEEVQLDIYNTAGERVFSGTSQSRGLSFQGLNNDGQRLANGVYFYVVTLKKVDNKIERLKVKQLVVLN